MLTLAVVSMQRCGHTLGADTTTHCVDCHVKPGQLSCGLGGKYTLLGGHIHHGLGGVMGGQHLGEVVVLSLVSLENLDVTHHRRRGRVGPTPEEVGLLRVRGLALCPSVHGQERVGFGTHRA